MTKEKKKEYQRKWYEANKAAERERSRLWRLDNPDADKESKRRRYEATAERINQLKLSVGCRECGFRAHPAALHFNHIDPATKLFSVAANKMASWSRIEAEIAKCEVLCANCHAIHTFDNKHHEIRR